MAAALGLVTIAGCGGAGGVHGQGGAASKGGTLHVLSSLDLEHLGPEGLLACVPRVDGPLPDRLPTLSAPEVTAPLLEARGPVKRFPVRHGLTRRLAGHAKAVDVVSLRLDAGETLGLVGESGCGKSTAARLLTRLIEPTSGTGSVAGRELTTLAQPMIRPVRRDLQMISQDPFSSLNPRQTVRQILTPRTATSRSAPASP
ncbi:ATP-binding cassette domain-containing protein [Streptomyces sp. NPDC007205]|uniref:ATP-binding cassette domain-containing protein n=1 Tax=Streptomyces sp. NPDC007205 TaxID=3154316 RepID=UPI003406F14E